MTAAADFPLESRRGSVVKRGDPDALPWKIYLSSVAMSFFVFIEPSPSDLVFTLALAAFLLIGFQRGVFLKFPIIFGVFLFIISYIQSLLYVNHDFIWAMRQNIVGIYMMLIFIITAYFSFHRGDRGFTYIVLALTIAGVLASIIGVMARFNLLPYSNIFFRDPDNALRVRATFKDPNVLGPFLVPALLFLVWMAAVWPKLRMIVAVGIGFVVAALIFTFSRGAWAHAVVSLGLFMAALLFERPKVAHAVFLAALIGLIGAAIVMLFLSEQLMDALSGSFFFKRLGLQSYDDSRFGYIMRALSLIADRPFGVGAGQARYEYGFLPHNTIIAIAVHNGVLAAAGFSILFIGSIARCMLKIFGQRPGWLKYAFLLTTLLGLMVLIQVIGAVHWRHVYVLMGLTFGEYRSNKLFV